MNIVFDTETSGLVPGQIAQLAYVIDDNGKVSGKNFYFAVNYISPSAASVNNLSVEALKELSGGKKFGDHAQEIYLDFVSADTVFAHNFMFDLSFMQAEFGRLGMAFHFNNHFCTMKGLTNRIKLLRSDGVSYKYPKLAELCEYFGVSTAVTQQFVNSLFGHTSQAHDARFDACAVYLSLKSGGLLGGKRDEASIV